MNAPIVNAKEAAVVPTVTIVVVPRERFGVARQSLESLYANTAFPFDLVYVDAGAPAGVSAWISEQSALRGFRVLRSKHMLTPNAARNLGWQACNTPYVVFVDNDVVFAPSWLTALVRCAEETACEVVAPMTCEGPEIHAVIHQAGGHYSSDREAFFRTARGQRPIIDAMLHQGERLADVSRFNRHETDNCEFHCVLVRRDALVSIGGLDENMLATKEHLDFCMSIHAAGGRVMLEPESVVTYLFPTRQHAMEPADFPFFLVRWSTDWQKRSLDHFRDKWGIVEDDYFRKRYRNLGWRRREGVVKTLVKRVPIVGRNRHFVRASTRVLDPLAWLWAKWLVRRQDRILASHQRTRHPDRTSATA